MYRNYNLVKKHIANWNYMVYNQCHVQWSTETAEHNYIVPFHHSRTAITNTILKTHSPASASWLLPQYLLTTTWGILLCNARISIGAMEMPLWNTMYHHMPTCVVLVWWCPIPDRLGQSWKYIKEKVSFKGKAGRNYGLNSRETRQARWAVVCWSWSCRLPAASESQSWERYLKNRD